MVGSKKRIVLYISYAIPLYLLLTFSINSLIPVVQPKSSGNLLEKTTHFIENSSNYDLIFVGDSRTYCGIEPSLFDASLDVSSINLAHWANWFPTQYPQFETLLPYMSAGSTVIWSIGHQNFLHASDDQSLKTNFPIGRKNISRYLQWGFKFKDITENLSNYAHYDMKFVLPSRPILEVVSGNKDRSLYSYSISKERSLSGSDNPILNQNSNDSIYQVISNHYSNDADVEIIEPFLNHGLITSAVVKSNLGHYKRVEIEKDFFRKEQRAFANRINAVWHEEDRPPKFDADERYWNAFKDILQIFKESGVNLIVNEIEEAPNGFGDSEDIRHYYTSFMTQRVKPHVIEMGFSYVKADFSILKNEDYFDYNHLNSDGIPKYDSMLIELLRPLIKK